MRLVVTGAPGSGGPALARALAATLGPGARVADPDAIVAFDRRLLERLGWWDIVPAPLPAGDPRPDPATIEDGQALVAGSAGILADDAIGLLLPWWRRILADRLVLVVPVADAEVAAWRTGLDRDIDAELALAGWLAWHRHLAAGSAGASVVCVDAAALASEPRSVLTSLVEVLREVGVPDLDGVAEASGSEAAGGDAGRPPPDAMRAALAVDARALRMAWCPTAVTLHAPAALTAPAVQPWESAVLALGRRTGSLMALRAGDQVMLASLEGAVADVARLVAELEAAGERVAELDARIAAAEEDAMDADARTQAFVAERDALRARAEELAGMEAARRSELAGAESREQALAVEHLRRVASPVGRFAARWAQLGDRARVVRAADRAMEAALQVASLRRPRILRPHPLFDAGWYRAQNDDVRTHGLDAYRHYRRHGSKEGRRPNPWLDPDWYRARYEDVRSVGADPIDHYHEHGWREGRDPGPDFDTGWYLRTNPDVLVSGMDPLQHYLAHGQAEGRTTRAPDGARWTLGPGVVEPAGPGMGAGALSGSGPSTAQEPLRRAWGDEVAAALEALPVGADAAILADRGGPPPATAGRSAMWLAPSLRGGEGGDLPASGRAAIARLETCRWSGVDHLLVHRDQSWWLQRQPELAAHLDRYRRVPLGGVPATAWRLTPVVRGATSGEETLIARIRRTVGRDLVTLAWDTPRTPIVEALGGTVFEPPAPGGSLPYLDGTIDVVAIGDDDPARLEEARRVAAFAVLRAAGRHGGLSPVWLAPVLADMTDVAVALLGSPAQPPTAAQVARVADSLLDATVEALIVAGDAPPEPAGGRLSRLGPGAPIIRHLPLDPDTSVMARAIAAAHATPAELIAILDGTAMPVPGWLPALAASLEQDAALDAVVPVLMTPHGLVDCSDGRDAGDARARVVRTVSAVGMGVVLVRRADILALERGDASAALAVATDGRSLDLARGGRVEPAALAIVEPPAETRS